MALGLFFLQLVRLIPVPPETALCPIFACGVFAFGTTFCVIGASGVCVSGSHCWSNWYRPYLCLLESLMLQGVVGLRGGMGIVGSNGRWWWKSLPAGVLLTDRLV